MRFLLILFFAIFGSMGAQAADYYWRVTASAILGGLPNAFGSASDACTAVYDRWGGSNIDYKTGQPAPLYVNDTTFQCRASYMDKNGTGPYTANTSTVTRLGDSCPPGTEYNAETGACDSAPSCADKLGDTTFFSISGVGNTDYMFITSDGSFSAPSQRGCFDGCSASTVDQSCQTSSLGPWRCGGTAVFDGGNCGEGTESPNIPTAKESPELEKPAAELTTQTQPCNYITQADGSQTCTSLAVEDHKGQTCGTFNGEVICPEIQPEYDSTQIDTTVTTEDNGDGTTTTTKTDVATVTNCTGTSCNTSTTTNTTINNGGSISGTCTGAQCPTAGNPDGNGDGLGDCVGSCEGSTGPLSLEGMGEGTSFGDTLDGYYDRISGSPIASAVTGISMPSNGSCSFPTASTYLFEVDLNFICQNADWLDPLRYVFLAIWAFAAVRVLMSA